MKKVHFIAVFMVFISVFYSCSTDVELYADYKDVAIVYAMLNPKADTNFVKLTRAFCGTNEDPIDATEVSLIADSCNYPGKLDARIIELKNTYDGPFEPTGRVFELDTITIHDKEVGAFYAPDQKMYYFTEPLYTGSSRNRYKYRLVVIKPDGDSLTAQTHMVGNEEFVIITGGVGFQTTPTDEMKQIYFRADGSASLYEISMQFNYLEQKTGQEIQKKSINRSFGTKAISEFHKIEGTENSYYQDYSVNWLFNALANAIGGDTVVNPNHPNVVRYIDNFIITISAASDELACYYYATEAQQYSPVGFVSVYSNIDGGFGLFSSRTNIKKEAALSNSTRRELFAKTSWGFKEQ